MLLRNRRINPSTTDSAECIRSLSVNLLLVNDVVNANPEVKVGWHRVPALWPGRSPDRYGSAGGMVAYVSIRDRSMKEPQVISESTKRSGRP